MGGSSGLGRGLSGMGGMGGSSGLSLGGSDASLKQSGVVDLPTLRDLEGVCLSLLDIVTGGPGESAILRLAGDGLYILQVGGASLSQGQGHRLFSLVSTVKLYRWLCSVIPVQGRHQPR